MSLPYSIVNPLARIEIIRHLTFPGKILVHEGDAVEPLQNVAEMNKPPEFRIVDVSRELNVPPKKAKQYLEVKVGARIARGQVLASRGGLGGRTCKAPFDGFITGYGRGRLLLEGASGLIQLNALVPGTVVQVLAGESVTVQTTGAFIHGAWGNGKESYGVLQSAVKTARHVLRAKRLDASAQGAIVIGGAALDEGALEQAIEMQVNGIIVGGISPSLIPKLREVNFPIVATEGVGEIPMSKVVFDLLRSLSGREAALSGLLETRTKGYRPYIVVPMPSDSGNFINPDTPLQKGGRVRAIRSPFLGLSGTITDFPEGKMTIDTGARVTGVQVEIDGDPVLLPKINLEQLL